MYPPSGLVPVLAYEIILWKSPPEVSHWMSP